MVQADPQCSLLHPQEVYSSSHRMLPMALHNCDFQAVDVILTQYPLHHVDESDKVSLSFALQVQAMVGERFDSRGSFKDKMAKHIESSLLTGTCEPE